MSRRADAEWERLTADHPEWVDVPWFDTRYWMYFRDDVRRARAEVYWRRAKQPILEPFERLASRLSGLAFRQDRA